MILNLSCVKPNGENYKYPAVDSKGDLCRTMMASHATLTTSDGDFEAFIRAVGTALRENGLREDEIMRVATAFGATRNDIVRWRDAGPTLPCDAADAGPDGATLSR